MNPVHGLLFLVAVTAGLLLSGYWLNSLDLADTFAERLALAALAGLATLILMVTAVNCFYPLSGISLPVYLLPAAGTVLWPRARNQLLADLRNLVRSRSGLVVLVLAAVFLAGLLSPALRDGQAMFYDGTSNHDSFYWITSASFLQHHTHLQLPEPSATQPWLNTANVWPRMGAEGLLALASSLAFTEPLNTYLFSTAALYLPWTAAVFLAATTFYRGVLSRGAAVVLVTLQPIFVFFHANSNLPNLVGTLTGAAVVIGTERALRAETSRSRAGWCTLLALGWHGLCASYPEMIPFVLLPGGLLWARHWFTRRAVPRWNPAAAVAAAFVAGTLVNPVIALRAGHCVVDSINTAHANPHWASLFAPLNPAAYVAGLATLSVPAASHLNLGLGFGLTAALLAAGLAGWRGARDRFGLLATLSGSAALLLYTLATGFNYGWQKTAQFGGVFIAVIPVVLLDTQLDDLRRTGWRRWLAGGLLATVLSFYGAATILNLRDIAFWSREKRLSLDWLDLRAASRTTLKEAPVLVDAPTFRMPFFHGMWSAYFLPASRIYFAERGDENGGYLHAKILGEPAIPPGRPPMVLVGRSWAETFDANSTRLLTGREYVLLQQANRVVKMQGVYPLNGFPEFASTRAALTIRPHSPARMRVTLAPRLKKNWPEASWRISHQAGTGPENILTVSGAPPWQFEVPLVAGQDNVIEFATAAPAGNTEILPFALTALKIDSAP